MPTNTSPDVVTKEKTPASCYMCEAPRTSSEHAPPQCLFPEEKTFGRDLRKNLVTVPSCDAHNSVKSQDDEEFRAILVMAATLNPNAAGHHQFLQKFMKAAMRAPGKYNSFFNEQGDLANRAGVVLQVNRAKFDSSIDHVVRALFFHEYKRKWALPIHSTSPNFVSTVKDGEAVAHGPSLQAAQVTMEMLKARPILGENPEVFKYRIWSRPDVGDLAFACQFYELVDVFAYSSVRFEAVTTSVRT
jgi:hypothetical protein